MKKNSVLLLSIITALGVFMVGIVDDANAARNKRKNKTSKALSQVCSKVVPLQLLIKKTAGGHITTGPRVTGFSVICSRKQCISGNKASFYYSDGEYAGMVGVYGIWVGNGQRRYYGGTSGAPQHFVSKIVAKAKKKDSGSTLYLALNKSKQCVAFDGTKRNGSPF